MQVLGLAGYARSGKDTVAEIIKKYRQGVYLYAFADPMKLAAREALGIPMRDLKGEGIDRDTEITRYGCTIRHILESIGRWGRHDISPDVWILRAEQELMMDSSISESFRGGDHDLFVVTDVRMKKEVEWVKSKGGVVLEIVRPDAKKVSESETEAGEWEGLSDFIIANDGTLEDLEWKVADFFQQVFDKRFCIECN